MARKSAKRPDTIYIAAKLAAGDFIQVKTTLKSAEDVADFRALEAAFPEEGRGGIAKIALRELAKRVKRRRR